MENDAPVRPSEYGGPTEAINPGGLTPIAAGQVVGVLSKDDRRLKFWIDNTSAVDVGVRFVSGAGAAAFYLRAGDVWEERDWKGPVYLFHASGSSVNVNMGVI